jgi:hypothetical protein
VRLLSSAWKMSRVRPMQLWLEQIASRWRCYAVTQSPRLTSEYRATDRRPGCLTSVSPSRRSAIGNQPHVEGCDTGHTTHTETRFDSDTWVLGFHPFHRISLNRSPSSKAIVSGCVDCGENGKPATRPSAHDGQA